MRCRLLGLVTIVLAAVGCGPSVITDAAPEAPTYPGPLDAGAVRALDCQGTPVDFAEDSAYGGGVDDDPLDALGRSVRAFIPDAAGGLRLTRDDAPRRLYTYEVDRRTRLAFVLRDGPGGQGDTGWYVESWARCDWSELPDRWSEDRGLQLWTDASGRRVASTTISSSAGPEHCDWQDMTFLALDGGSLDGGRSFVAHPEADLYPTYFSVPYAESRPLPADASDTGWERDGRHLWLAPDDSRAYVGTTDAVDVWPAEVQPLGCA